MQEELKELITQISEIKILLSNIIPKILTFYELNSIPIPDIIKYEYAGYDGIDIKDMPSYRIFPPQFMFTTYQDMFGRKMKLSIADYLRQDKKWIEIIEKGLPIHTAIIDFETQPGNMVLSLDNIFGGLKNKEVLNQSFILEIPSPQIQSIIGKVRGLIHKELIELAKTLKISFKQPLEFDEKLLKKIQDQRIIKTLKEAWKCYDSECFIAAAVMLRKVIEISIIIGFRRKFGNVNKFIDNQGNYHQLAKKLEIIRQEKLVNGSILDNLIKNTKLVGDLAAHNFNVKIIKLDVLDGNKALRLFIDDFISNTFL